MKFNRAWFHRVRSKLCRVEENLKSGSESNRLSSARPSSNILESRGGSFDIKQKFQICESPNFKHCKLKFHLKFQIYGIFGSWNVLKYCNLKLKKKLHFNEISEKYFRPFCNNLQFAICNAEIILNFKLAFFEKLVQF